MNYHSRVDEYLGQDGFNQNPPSLSPESTTRQSLNGLVNLRTHKEHDRISDPDGEDAGDDGPSASLRSPTPTAQTQIFDGGGTPDGQEMGSAPGQVDDVQSQTGEKKKRKYLRRWADGIGKTLVQYARYIGPGVMISVAYTDPGNYSTDVGAGAVHRFKLLFVVLMANIIAVFLQSLCIKLGTITGLNLAEHCRVYLPRWLNLALYLFAESAIIATDIAEVIGTAIALNILLNIPLVAGCAITIVDVLIVLLFYSSDGSMRRIRIFEIFIMALVIGVVVCFCIELAKLPPTDVREVFAGYLPSSTVVQGSGLYLSCGIIGATVMPHSLYLGSGIVQSRLYAYAPEPLADDVRQVSSSSDSHHSALSLKLRRPTPPISTIKSNLRYSIVELGLSLCTLALFTNSAILILAGASLSGTEEAEGADIFTIHDLLSSSVAPVAGTIFALALLLSGLSAGVVCTLAGQMISEGALRWKLRPWVRRLVTRSISIVPCIVVAGAVGREGLGTALNASQVALSVILPFVSAPVIWFTCRAQYMMVRPSPGTQELAPHPSRLTGQSAAAAVSATAGSASDEPQSATRTSPNWRLTSRLRKALSYLARRSYDAKPGQDLVDWDGGTPVNMRNGWLTIIFAVLVWLLLAVMNVSLLVLVGLGRV